MAGIYCILQSNNNLLFHFVNDLMLINSGWFSVAGSSVRFDMSDPARDFSTSLVCESHRFYVIIREERVSSVPGPYGGVREYQLREFCSHSIYFVLTKYNLLLCAVNPAGLFLIIYIRLTILSAAWPGLSRSRNCSIIREIHFPVRMPDRYRELNQ